MKNAFMLPPLISNVFFLLFTFFSTQLMATEQTQIKKPESHHHHKGAKEIFGKEKIMSSVPDNPQELWERTIDLFVKSSGIVTKDQVERQYGIRFKENKFNVSGIFANELGDSHYLSMETINLGRFEVILEKNENMTTFGIQWGSPNKEIYCLSLDKPFGSLMRLGWSSAGRNSHPGNGLWEFYIQHEIDRIKTIPNWESTQKYAHIVISTFNQPSNCANGFIWTIPTSSLSMIPSGAVQNENLR